MPRLGFVGLGLMGEPMAANLLRAGNPLTVWNRTAAKAGRLAALGARVAPDVDALFAYSDVVFAMLADEPAIDDVTGRGSAAMARRLCGRTFVQMGTTSPTYSRGLAADVARAGGRYVEAPVSGSRLPAERRELVAMVAGDVDAVADVLPFLAAMCRDSVPFGPVPAASTAKLAVNLFLIAMVTGLAESVVLAKRYGLDAAALARVLDGGPMASTVSRTKLAKLLASDHAPQAAAADVLKNCRLICDAAEAAGFAAPLATACRELFTETVAIGRGAEDMSAVLEALAAHHLAVGR